jgi:hypothetical protein
LEGQLLPTLHTLHNASYADIVYIAWQLGAIEVNRPSDLHRPGVVNLLTAMATMHKTYTDAQAWFAGSDG